ncbi:helix-turn-helix domain-containing protein [Microvirga alba]|uniref:Helix-turn-helix domain-containing protein n=1 Tax=Microvirga alba TaxID=2791025 RepID=A0A931FMK9_9HYPH|nr:helix-turn-helix domain-containing protein [Microvirga alba]MBF9232655.1 helix-turn-helix domain-containing protein [Microvirga alba]
MAYSASPIIDHFAGPIGQARLSLEDVFATRVSEFCHAGHSIFWEGDVASDTFRVSEGVLRLYRILPDGRRAITGFAFPGDVLGLAFHDRYFYTAEAVTTVRLRRFPHGRLQALAADCPHLHYEILQVIANELGAAQEQMVLLGQKSAEERVASFLLMNGLRVAKDRSAPIVFDLPMTRLDMADYLGLTIETVCRAVTKLRQAGLVSLEGRHKVFLHKPDELARFAGQDDSGCPGMIKVTHQASWPRHAMANLNDELEPAASRTCDHSH